MRDGNVNVSRFGPRLAGAGGFINISQSARRVLFAGTFTTGGLEVKVARRQAQIVREGKARKFVKAVEQITFNGAYAAEIGQPVLYVTERCVFRRTPRRHGARSKSRPGIDIERDILAHMDFTPIVDDPRAMDARIFRDEPMQLEDTLLGLGLAERISYDAERNTVFLNLEGMHVRNARRRRPRPARGRGALPEGRQEGRAGRELRQLRDRPRGRRHLRGDDPLHGDALLHDRVAVHDERVPAAEARRGAGAPARRAAHLRDGGRSARVRAGYGAIPRRTMPLDPQVAGGAREDPRSPAIRSTGR